jgi:hypothetical protein
MKRRDLLVGAGAAALAPRVGWAQQPNRNYRLGFVALLPRAGYAVLLAELHHLGFIEGSNLSVDPHGFGLPVERL